MNENKQESYADNLIIAQQLLSDIRNGNIIFNSEDKYKDFMINEKILLRIKLSSKAVTEVDIARYKESLYLDENKKIKCAVLVMPFNITPVFHKQFVLEERYMPLGCVEIMYIYAATKEILDLGVILSNIIVKKSSQKGFMKKYDKIIDIYIKYDDMQLKIAEYQEVIDKFNKKIQKHQLLSDNFMNNLKKMLKELS